MALNEDTSSRESWASDISAATGTSGVSGDYWYGNKGCDGCNKEQCPDGMHPSQTEHMEKGGCLGMCPRRLRTKRKAAKRARDAADQEKKQAKHAKVRHEEAEQEDDQPAKDAETQTEEGQEGSD
jgi:hypothetical protein